MDGRTKLQDLFSLHDQYKSLYDNYLRRGVNQVLDRNDKEFGPQETRDHYFSVGADALRLVIGALTTQLRAPPKTILDFPSGSGRVTRHFRACFPNAKVVACDLYDYHVEFCVRELGAAGVLSREAIEKVEFGGKFDLIFCGSLLTHFPDDLFKASIRLLADALSPQGIALVTLHGRFSTFIQEHRWKYIDDRLYAVAAATLPTVGFGYVDYDHDFRTSAFSKQARYGISFSFPHWTLRIVEEDSNVRVLGYIERAWDDHHDVLIIGKPGINE